MINIFEMRFKKVVNLGNYESETFEAACQLSEGECANSAKAELEAFVRGTPVGSKVEVTSEAVPTPEPVVIKEEETESTVIPRTAIPKKARKPKTNSEAPAAVVDDAKPTEEVKAAVEPVEEEAKPEAKKDKKFKSKATPYNRENDLHKKLLGEVLDKEYPTWKKDPSKAKAASLILAGKDFLDAEGMVLQSFKSELKTAMA